jgi:type IV secretory pathway VirD2 relaxase
VQLHKVEAELYRQTLVISVRETPQLTLLHLQRKGRNQQHERFLFLVNTLPRNCNFV